MQSNSAPRCKAAGIHLKIKSWTPHSAAQAIRVYRPYHIFNKMMVTCWYKNGNKDTFRQFCIQNQDRPISAKLTNRSEPIKGPMYSYCFNSSEKEGLFFLLSDRVTHPANYGLDCIESLHIGLREARYSWADNGYLSDGYLGDHILRAFRS